MNYEKAIDELVEKVIENDFCIGCGICASLKGSPLEMKLNDLGKYQPIRKIIMKRKILK